VSGEGWGFALGFCIGAALMAGAVLREHRAAAFWREHWSRVFGALNNVVLVAHATHLTEAQRLGLIEKGAAAVLREGTAE
jgi:hypothetical protein